MSWTYDTAMAVIKAGSAERLARDVVGSGPSGPLAAELRLWLAGSSRFTAFVEAHRSKIRKKLRGAADEASVRDVRTELAIARLVLADRRFELAFEAYGRGGGPDFTLTYRAGRSFNVEVTRLRRGPTVDAVAGVVLGKLRQLPPSVPNLLVVAVDEAAADEGVIGAAIRTLRSRADSGDDAYFAYRGLDGTRAFHERFLRLGGVVVWCETAVPILRAVSWTNNAARSKIPEGGARALVVSLRA